MIYLYIYIYIYIYRSKYDKIIQNSNTHYPLAQILSSLRPSPFVHIFWCQIIVVPAKKKLRKTLVRQKVYGKQ